MIIGNQGFFSYSRYNMLRIVAVLEEFNTLHCRNSKYIIYNIDIRGDVSSSTRRFKLMIKNDERYRKCEVTKKS